MAINLGAVATGLLAVGSATGDEFPGASAAKLLGAILMPVAICFALYSGSLFAFRRDLLRKDDLFNPDMHSTRIPLILGYILCIALCGIFGLGLLGGVVQL